MSDGTVPEVARRASGTPALAEARIACQNAEDAVQAAVRALDKAGYALPGARAGILLLRDEAKRLGEEWAKEVAAPFDRAVLDELLARTDAKKK